MGLYVLEAGRSLGWRRSSPTNASPSQQLRMAYDRGGTATVLPTISFVRIADVFACAHRRQNTGEPAPGQSGSEPARAALPVRRPIPFSAPRGWLPISRLRTTPETTKGTDLRI